jgi:hypothetical protein
MDPWCPRIGRARLEGIDPGPCRRVPAEVPLVNLLPVRTIVLARSILALVVLLAVALVEVAGKRWL